MSLSWLLIFLLAAVLGTDWLLPLRGVLSFGLAAAVSVLALPWVVLTLRFASAAKEEQLDPRQQKLARERRLRGFVLRLALVLLVVTFLLAKWWLLLEAGGSDQGFAVSSRSYTLGLGLMMALGLLARDLRASRFLATASLHPARLMALSFGGVGLVGALLLALPVSVRAAEHVSLVDHVFMARLTRCLGRWCLRR
jgi:hypothetical protein